MMKGMRINGIGYDSKLTASERRILISHWVGEAWNKLCAPEYDNLRRRCWEKTGCLMTADGSEDPSVVQSPTTC